MAKLTEEQYEEYLRLLKAWVQADAPDRVAETYAAVQDFRSRYGLGEREEDAEPRPARVRRH
jgi:hypothetical protein